MTLLDVHHGLLAASALVQAITRVSTTLALLWLAWQILFRSGLKWRWFRAPQLFGRPVAGVRVQMSFIPSVAKFWHSFPLLPRRDSYEWTVRWLWFQVRWDWVV